MADGFRVEVKGIEQANRNIATLERKLREKVIRKAVRVGTNVERDAVRQEAPKDTGTFRKAHYTKIKFDRRIGVMSGRVEIRDKKYPNGRRPSKYQHLITLGTSPHVIPGPVVIGGNVATNIQHPGTSADDYMDRAFRRTDRQALKAFQVEYGRGVNAAVRALPK